MAGAQTIGTIVDNMFASGQLMSISRIIEAIAYLGGIGLGIKAMYKLHDWNDSKGRNAKLSTALIYLVCSGLMLALPSIIKVGSETFLGQSASQNFQSGSGQYGGQY